MQGDASRYSEEFTVVEQLRYTMDRQLEGSRHRMRWIRHKIYHDLFLARYAHAHKQVHTRNVRNLQDQFSIEMDIIGRKNKAIIRRLRTGMARNSCEGIERNPPGKGEVPVNPRSS
ncbi:hypothetical protein QQP08_000739 [Theobroma cacao]|nr:hypothetical protein QQP08_000739 [Theobroma cacao]